MKMAAFLKKGTQVHVQGNFNVTTYQDKNRNWCSGINLHATNIQLLTPKKNEELEKGVELLNHFLDYASSIKQINNSK
jgi:single-stranded DNA-binding protein